VIVAAIRLLAPPACSFALHRVFALFLFQAAAAVLFRIDCRARRPGFGLPLAAGTGCAIAAHGAAALCLGLVETAAMFVYGAAVGIAVAVGPRPTPAESRATPFGPLEFRMKRCFDLAVGLTAVVPIVLLIGLIRTARDPIWKDGFLYRQLRTGLFGRLFLVTKIRTMSKDAEGDGRPRWSERATGSISRTGSMLRGRWADELPQIFDVLAGRLSLVGPRPERPEFIEGLTARWPKYARRLSVPPGITGLAQILGYAGDTSIRRRVVCDRWYARRWTPWTDLRLLVATAYFAVARRRRPSRATKGEFRA